MQVSDNNFRHDDTGHFQINNLLPHTMQHISGNLIVSRWPIMNGSAQDPALNFSGANQSGVSYSNTVNIHVIQNTPLVIQNTGITLPGTCAATKLVGNGAQLTMIPPLALSNVQIVDAANVPLDDTALDSSNQGYLRLNGRGFAPGSLVSVGNTLAASATMYSQQQIFAQIQPKSVGTYSVSITRADGISTTLPMAVSFSPFPVWTSATTLANVAKNVAFTQTLAASDPLGANVSYAIASGSSLPANVSLSSVGVLSGNITTDPGNSTTYSFIIDAIDAQFQNIPRAFSLFANGVGYSSISAMRSDMSTSSTPTGTYRLFYNGTLESVYVLNTGLELWMLVGVGRENFNFTDVGSGTLSQITANKDTNSPFWAPSSFVRDVMNSAYWTNNSVIVQRFDGCNDSLRYQLTSANISFNWSLFNPGDNVGVSPYAAGVTRYAGTSWWTAATSYTTASTSGYWVDTYHGNGNLNDANRAFTWAWSGHNYVKGFSAGSTVTTGYQVASEGHAIQRINVWACLKQVSPPGITGLVGWYDGDSWTGTQWTDKSGSGNHATTIRGTIGTSTNPKGGIVLTGGTSAGIQFPVAILPATYTLFHVAKYTTGGTRGRIFDGTSQNWLSGFHGGRSGVAYHNGWITPQTDLHGYNWVVSTDQNNLYRSNGVLRGNSGAGAPSYDRISINYGTGAGSESSDWTVSEVIVYNRTLTADEIMSVEGYLYTKTGV